MTSTTLGLECILKRSELNVRTVKSYPYPLQSFTHHAAIRRVEVGDEVGTRKRFQGSDWQGPPMNKCSSLFLSLFCSQTAMQCWRSVALLSEGRRGPAGPRKNLREDPVLLVPSDRFVQAPQGNVKSKIKFKKKIKNPF